ncbi:MAG: cytochrome C biogenesis protein [Sphingomonadaceae bacterium]|nr:cytochrome C biogenesis protein [Sphingomonadaceae bacterium]
MSWLVLLAFAAIAFAALWRWGRLPRFGLELTAAALCVAVAGYAWLGSPGIPAHPVESREAMGAVDPQLIATRKSMMGQFGTDAQWLDFADTLGKLGQSRAAVTAMRSGIRDDPRSADLWVGLGNALVAHADGLVTPAAEFAFQRAAHLSPEHPGPPFFFGLALAQNGRTAEAGEIWRALLARTPANAPWREDLLARLMSIGEMTTGAAKP